MNDLSQWKDLIRNGIKYRDSYGNKDGCWDNNKKYYRHQFEAELPYNLVFGMARVMIPTVYFRNPYINVAPTFEPRLLWHARMLEGIDNYLMAFMGIKKLIKKLVLDTYLCGSGWAKVGYDSQFGFFPEDKKAGVLGDVSDSTLSQTSKSGERLEYNSSIMAGYPWVGRIPPSNIIVPFGTQSINDCEWVAHIVLRSVDDVKNDPKYKNTANLTASHMELLKDGDRVEKDLYKEVDKGRQLVELVEIRDLKRGEIKVLCMGYDKWLRPPEEDVLQFNSLPFVHMQWNDDPDYVWGIGDATLIAPQQKEMNDTRDLLQAHRKISRSRIMADEGIFSDEEIQKINRGEVGAVIRGKGINRENVQEFNTSMPGDLAAWLNIIREDVRELLGFSRVQMGEFEPTGRRTATEVANVQQAHSIRMDEKRDAVADFIVTLMKKVNQVVFSFWNQEKVVQMVGQEGVVHWVQYTPSAIKGDYDVRVDVESMMPSTRANRKQEVVEVMHLLSQMPGISISYLVQVLAKEYDWLDIMDLFPQNQQPVDMNAYVQQQKGLQPSDIQSGRSQIFNQLERRLVG